MHNKPQQPLDELATLREENKRLKSELAAYKDSECNLSINLIQLLKAIGADPMGKPVFIGSALSIARAIETAKANLDASERLEKQYQ